MDDENVDVKLKNKMNLLAHQEKSNSTYNTPKKTLNPFKKPFATPNLSIRKISFESPAFRSPLVQPQVKS